VKGIAEIGAEALISKPRLRLAVIAHGSGWMSWDQRFFDPIVLPGRKLLVTLRDAALYITKLPKAEHDADEWQAAMEAHDRTVTLSRI
jgi:hypothetical protein